MCRSTGGATAAPPLPPPPPPGPWGPSSPAPRAPAGSTPDSLPTEGNFWIQYTATSVADPDPHGFGPP